MILLFWFFLFKIKLFDFVIQYKLFIFLRNSGLYGILSSSTNHPQSVSNSIKTSTLSSSSFLIIFSYLYFFYKFNCILYF